MKTKTRYRVSNAFTVLSDNDLIGFVLAVITCLTGNAAFPSLPVSLTEVSALLAEFQDAVNAMALSSSAQLTAERDAARIALLDALRKTAASNSTAQTPLPVPAILSLQNLASTEVLLRLSPITNAKSYETQLSTDGGKTWVSGGISSKARRIVLKNLVPGTVYTVQARAIGGSTGQSGWSTPVPIMAT
jgi:hypothetical protein